MWAIGASAGVGFVHASEIARDPAGLGRVAYDEIWIRQYRNCQTPSCKSQLHRCEACYSGVPKRVDPVRVLALALLMLITTVAGGCFGGATLHPLSTKLDVWVGKSAVELERRLGRPSVEQRSDEGRFLSFTSDQGCQLLFSVDLTDTIGQAFWSGPEVACSTFITRPFESPRGTISPM